MAGGRPTCFQTLGELCLSPVGLSAMSRLAPARIAGLVMGVWFLALSVGNYLAGMASSVYETMPLPTLFTHRHRDRPGRPRWCWRC